MKFFRWLGSWLAIFAAIFAPDNDADAEPGDVDFWERGAMPKEGTANEWERRK